jgi:methylenetetrahydrofolate reductase (NADPH)
MRSRVALAEWLERMRDAGADAILLIAGDRRQPAGAFHDTLDVLDTGLVEGSGFRRIAVAGHPEGHAKASDEALITALRRKAAWARETDSEIRIVTQFAFSAAPVIDWYARMSAENIGIPLRIGLPGPAKTQTLLRYAAQCGVGASARMLMRRPGTVSRLLSRWSPQEMIESLADGLPERRGMPVEGVHVFPFGGLSRTIEMFGALGSHAAGMQRTASSGA